MRKAAVARVWIPERQRPPEATCQGHFKLNVLDLLLALQETPYCSRNFCDVGTVSISHRVVHQGTPAVRHQTCQGHGQ